MKKRYKIIIGIAFLLGIAALIYFNNFGNNLDNNLKANVVEEKQDTSEVQNVPEQTALPTPVRYFKPSSDKIVISAGKKVLYSSSPTTTLSYYALDGSGNFVHFEKGDKAFVRILGIMNVYTQNTEIFHPKTPNGSEDNTLFYGNITITEPGKYLVKVCLGKSINLDKDGNMVWPFGCFEDSSSEVIDVYDK